MNSEIQTAISRTPYPQKSALLLGLGSDLSAVNPYKQSNKMQPETWAKSFYKAFEKGRKLKIKHKFQIQLKLC